MVSLVAVLPGVVVVYMVALLALMEMMMAAWWN